jgi:hypothetical protein
MGLFIKIIAIGAGVVLIVGVLGLFIMSGVAVSHDVERVPVPVHSFFAVGAAGADYVDAYQAPMPYSGFRTIEQVIANAFHKGSEIYREDNEVVYECEAPGLKYRIAYILDREANPPTLTVAVRVHHITRTGLWYVRVVRPVYRLMIPIAVDRMVQAAASL